MQWRASLKKKQQIFDITFLKLQEQQCKNYWTQTRLVCTHLNALYYESKYGNESLTSWKFVSHSKFDLASILHPIMLRCVNTMKLHLCVFFINQCCFNTNISVQNKTVWPLPSNNKSLLLNLKNMLTNFHRIQFSVKTVFLAGKKSIICFPKKTVSECNLIWQHVC